MPSFSTPEPVQLTVRNGSGDVVLEASARADTTVDVEPENPHRDIDVDFAERTKVDHTDGRVLVEVPKPGSDGSAGSVVVRVALPEGSDAKVKTASADVQATGRLGDVDVATVSGEVSLEEVGALRVNTANGDVQCSVAGGDVKVDTASGDVSVLEIAGRAEVSTASGAIEIRQVGGDLKLNSVSGDASIGTAHGSVSAKTASGDVAVKSIEQGRFSAYGASGDVMVGVAAGTAAWLDVNSLSGDVMSRLEEADLPGPDEKTVEIHVRTLSGNVAVTRA